MCRSMTVAATSTAVEIRTARLVLRPWADADRDEFARWSRDAEATRYVLRGPLADDEVDRHHAQSLEQWRLLGFGARAVLDGDTGRWAGFVDVSHVGPGKGCRADDLEIGYFLLPFAWGRGLATEAATAVRDDAFHRVGVLELLGRYRVENEASRRVLEKLGFEHIRRHRFPDGNVAHVTRLTRDAWCTLAAVCDEDPQNEGSRRPAALPRRESWQ